jgi:putative colanic acid biosynthesis acetyltransferase WcaF
MITPVQRDLSAFKTNRGFKDTFYLSAWTIFSKFVFGNTLTPNALRIMLLRLFGAKIDKNVVIKSGVKVLDPRNLSIGCNSWIGQDCWIINHNNVDIGCNVCISQGVVLCSSSHDFLSPDLKYKHSPILIENGVWICLRANILPGSIIGENSVISAGEVFSGALSRDSLFKSGKSQLIDY